MIVARENEVDRRIQKLPLFRGEYMITEAIEAEKNNLLQKENYKKIFRGKTKIIKFEPIRHDFPDACILFYNYITIMHNPAHISSPYFLNELFINFQQTGLTLNKQQDIAKMRLSDVMNKSARSQLSGSGEVKSEAAKIIDTAYQQHIRKKRKANPRDSNYLNDYRSLALAVIYTLQNKVNTTYITSDSDIIIALCNLTESVAQQTAFKYFILDKIKQDGAIKLWQGKASISLGSRWHLNH